MHRAQKGKHDDYQNEVSCSKNLGNISKHLGIPIVFGYFCLLLNPPKKESVTHHIKLHPGICLRRTTLEQPVLLLNVIERDPFTLENWAQNPPVFLLSHLFAAIKIGDPQFSDTNPESLDVRDVLSSGYLTVCQWKITIFDR